MNAKKLYAMMTSMLLFLAFVNGSIFSATYARDEDDPTTKDYQAAYGRILDENWNEAIAGFEKLISAYPGSLWEDDAQFWTCYAREKTGEPPESVFALFRQFIEKYPDSKWVNDARKSMIRIGGALADAGKPEFRAIVESMQKNSNKDVLLAALFALRNVDTEKALPALMKILDENKDSDVQDQVIFILGNLDDPRAKEKLSDVALYGKDEGMRERAIFWLGQKASSAETIAILEKIVNSDASRNIREKAIFAISQADRRLGLTSLSNIARKNPDSEMRGQAVFWLGQNSSDGQTLDVLKEIIGQDPDTDVREKAIFAVSEMPNRVGMPVLKELAVRGNSREVKEKAIFWIGQKAESKEDLQTLQDVITNESDADLRKKALFALSQAPDKLGMEALAAVAGKHPDTGLRKEAIFWIGQKASGAEDVSLLKSIIDSDPDTEIREQAVFALSQVKKELGLPLLIELAKNHKDKVVRTKAIFWLGESNDPRAREALLEIINRE